MTGQASELERGPADESEGKGCAATRWSSPRLGLVAVAAVLVGAVAVSVAVLARRGSGRKTTLPSPSRVAPAPHPVAAEAVEGRYDMVDQDGARIPAEGEVRLYFVDGSNVAWQTWPDQLHAYLRKLNFTVPEENYSYADLMFPTELAPVCDDEAEFEDQRTPRIARPGWGSWGFAYDSRDDCVAAPFVGEAKGEHPFRTIAGHAVSCLNGWACNPHKDQHLDLVRPSDVVEDAALADVVLLSTWVNDFKQQYCDYKCFNGTELDPEAIAPVSVANLRRLIQAISARNPAAFIVVIALYPDAKRTLLVEGTLEKIAAINAAVREGVSAESNVAFVDFELAPGQDMFQVKPPGHPNCRGDRIMATQVLRALFDHKILGRTLALPEGQRAGECLRATSCGDIADKACCQAAAICRVDPDGECVAYSPGVGAM